MQKAFFACFLVLLGTNTFAQKSEKTYIIDSSPADTAGLWSGMQHLAQGMEAQDILINGRLPTEVAAETYRNLAVIEVVYVGLESYETRVARAPKIPKNAAFVEVLMQYNGWRWDNVKQELHKGVLVCHKTVAADLKTVFGNMLQRKFPIYKVQPANMSRFAEDPADGWDDEYIMRENITTCFNFRLKTNRTALSLHAEGKAIDINPNQNPYEMYAERGKFTHPEGAIYDKNAEGAISDENIVQYFDALGWQWAGRWTNPVDYQHFQKNKRSRKACLVGDVDMKNYFWTEDATDEVYFYKNKRKKELNQPDFVIYKNEKPLLQRLFYALDEKNMSILLAQKGTTRFENLPNTVWDYQITDRNGNVFDKNTLLSVKDYTPLSPKNNTPDKPLARTKMVIAYSKTGKDAADILKIKLENAGASVIFTDENDLKNADIKDSIFLFNPHLTLNLRVEKGDIPQSSTTATKAKLYIQGNWKAKNYRYDTPKNHDNLDFLRLLMTDDFEKSAAFANALNKNLTADTTPFRLHYDYYSETSIQSEEPNIYYRFDKNMLNINGACVTVVATPNAVASRFANDCFQSIVQFLK
jgi:D-alanyl-D-alanine carboxypeptidase